MPATMNTLLKITACALAIAMPAQVAYAQDERTEASAPVEIEVPPIEIVQDYEIKPALWKLSDEDTTIHLFGTIHLLPEQFRWRNEQFDAIAASADELVVESTDADMDADMGDILPALVLSFMMRVPTSEQLSPESAKKWRKVIDHAGQPFDEIDSMPVLFALMGLGLSQVEDMGSAGEYGVETILEAEFAARERPAFSIESSADVMNALLDIDEDLAVASLETTLVEWDGSDIDRFFEAGTGGEETAVFVPLADEHKWAQGGDVGFTEEDFPDDEYGRELRRIILTERNRAWAQWLDDRLDQPGNVLVAVGAGHFYGHDSVLAMLEERGLTAERIN